MLPIDYMHMPLGLSCKFYLWISSASYSWSTPSRSHFGDTMWVRDLVVRHSTVSNIPRATGGVQR